MIFVLIQEPFNVPTCQNIVCVYDTIYTIRVYICVSMYIGCSTNSARYNLIKSAFEQNDKIIFNDKFTNGVADNGTKHPIVARTISWPSHLEHYHELSDFSCRYLKLHYFCREEEGLIKFSYLYQQIAQNFLKMKRGEMEPQLGIFLNIVIRTITTVFIVFVLIKMLFSLLE